MSDKEDEKAKSRPISGDREEEKQPSTPSLKTATHKLKTEALRRLQLEGGDLEAAPESAEGSHGTEGNSTTGGGDKSQPIEENKNDESISDSLNKDGSNLSESGNEYAGLNSDKPLEESSDGNNRSPSAAETSKETGILSTVGDQERSEAQNEIEATRKLSSEAKGATLEQNTSDQQDAQVVSQNSSGSRPGSGKRRPNSGRKSASRPTSDDKVQGGRSRPSSGKDASIKNKDEVAKGLRDGKGSPDVSVHKRSDEGVVVGEGDTKPGVLSGQSRESGAGVDGGAEENVKGTQDMSSGESSSQSGVKEHSTLGADGNEEGVAATLIEDEGNSTAKKDGEGVGKDVINGKSGSEMNQQGALAGDARNPSVIDSKSRGETQEDVDKNVGEVTESQTKKDGVKQGGENQNSQEKAALGQESQAKNSEKQTEANKNDEFSKEISPPVGDAKVDQENGGANTDNVSKSKQEMDDNKDDAAKVQTSGESTTNVTEESDHQKNSDVDDKAVNEKQGVSASEGEKSKGDTKESNTKDSSVKDNTTGEDREEKKVMEGESKATEPGNTKSEKEKSSKESSDKVQATESTEVDFKEKAGKKKKEKKGSKKEKSMEEADSMEETEDGAVEKEEGADAQGKATGAGDVIGKVDDDEERVLPDDFYYDFEDLVSRPFASEGVPPGLLSLHHSFGYECTKRSNLHVLDEENVLFSAGNTVEILNIKTQQQTHIRTTSAGGIGSVAVHPSRKYFAVAEKGTKPNINIFEYPSLKLHRILRDGTEEAYAHLDFSPKGEKLASVGSAPDYMLTLWDWKNEKVILRSKAFSQDVYKVAFSPDNDDHLCSSGTGHIRFWSMAYTFTGLKLQGQIGKFGAKEISDVEGFVELPDGKVLSGSEWGNMLLWDGGLIKVEISKKGKKPCHNGMIEQFFMDEGELMTIGADGFVKVWDFESIDNADTTEEGQLFEMDPMYELKVGTDVKLISMIKAVGTDAPIWYAQDAGGGIWKLDLSFTHTSHSPERMFSYHAGTITGLETSPVAHFVATCGMDCTVRVYDYLAKLPMCQGKYSAGGSSLLWVPKVVDTKGVKLLAGFTDGVVRLLTLNKVDQSQVRGKKSKSNYELNLLQVFKPHTKPVTALTIDDEGEILASGSDDGTVFFFTVGDTYKPIGFVETASPVVSLSWSKKGKRAKSLLVSCKDGAVLEVEAPEPGGHDTSKTYHLPLDNLKITEFQFKSVKDKLRKAEKEEIKAKELEEKRKKKEQERARRRARGLEEEEEPEEEEEEENVEKEEEEEIEHEAGEVIQGFYHGKKDKFWLSMDGWDAGYMYECEFDNGKKPPSEGQEDTTGEPLRSVPVDNSNDVPVRSIWFSHSSKFLFMGMDNGALRIHPLDSSGELNSFGTYWALNVHDNHSGGVVKVKTSFDDKYVFTVGKDGNFFVFKFMDKAVKGLKVQHKVSIPSAKKMIGEEGEEVEKKIDDIDDPNFYSIELEKQKAEHDRMVKLAEEKKQNVRRDIVNLRWTFKQLMTRNQKLPPHVQAGTEEFELDPEIAREQKAKTEEKVELVRKEMSWDAEKYAIGLRKLQMRFKDEIECERIVLRAFLTSHLVSTFRACKPNYVQQLLQKAEGEAAKAGEGPEASRKSFSVMSKAAAQMKRRGTQEKVGATTQQQQAPPSQSQLGSKVAKALEKAEARKKKRLARQAQWNELYRTKPDENYEDPKDVTAIKEAREHMGDYKLKTAKDYVVPESLRVNAEKKRTQLLNLLDQIHQYKFDFNQKFLAMRDKKIRIIKELKECVVNLETLQQTLDPYSRRTIPKIPEMMPDECPEKRLEYTREKLLEFKKEMEERATQVQHDDQGGGFGGGFGGFGGGDSSKPATHGSKPLIQQRDRTISSVSLHSAGRPKSGLSTVPGSPEPAIEELVEEPSALEQEIQYEVQVRLQYEQDVLVEKIISTLEKFDADLRTLRHEKMNVEVALKCADLRQVTLFEEFMLLKEFEKRENIFANKVNTKLTEKDEMQEKVEECQMKLESKKQDIEKLQEQEKSLYTAFSASLGENNKFEMFLTKVFKKRIKRAKKKAQTEEGSDEESEDEESDDDLSSSDEEDSEGEELDDSVCPPGCDPALFDLVCQMREKRLDLEEELAEEKKTSEALKKEYDALVKKEKIIDGALNTAEQDLEAFQREKQQKLNELDVVVVLRLNQIQYMLNTAIPQDLSPCLVFTDYGLVRLQHRIKELEKEKADQKRLYREHRQTHVQLIRDKKVVDAKIAELEEKVKNMQMLKFGRLVDLEKLETVTVNRTVEELKETLRQAEYESAIEIGRWEGKIDSYKTKMTQLTRENTQRLDTFTVLLQEKKELEHMLDSRQKSLGTEFSGSRKADIRERQRLVQLVQLQAQEIDALKDEITLLSRKGGHILPPAQPPLPPGQTPIPTGQ